MSELQPGQSLGRYRVENKLGGGGMGKVYRAFDSKLKRVVALKVMHEHLSEDDIFRERFLHEAQFAAGLDHPGIVKVHEIEEIGEKLFIVMEFIPGDNLQKILEKLREKKQWLGLDETCRLIKHIGLALDYCHQRNIWHRDIKPANIMLKDIATSELAYQPVITDMGLAKSAEGEGLTHTGVTMGTPAYMSPEQALGDPIDQRTDIYSLGVIFYELAVGEVPYPAKNLSDAIRYHTRSEAPPVRERRADLPKRVGQIIDKALAKKPEDRYLSARELVADINEVDDKAYVANVPSMFEAGLTSFTTQLYQSIAQTGEKAAQTPQILAQMPSGMQEYHPLLQSLILIGRGVKSQIRLDDQKVSQRHLQVEYKDGGWQVTDLDSTNGSYLDGEKLTPGVARHWYMSQQLRIGDYSLQLTSEQPPQVQQPGSQRGMTGVPRPEESRSAKPTYNDTYVQTTIAPEQNREELRRQADIDSESKHFDLGSLRRFGLPLILLGVILLGWLVVQFSSVSTKGVLQQNPPVVPPTGTPTPDNKEKRPSAPLAQIAQMTETVTITLTPTESATTAPTDTETATESVTPTPVESDTATSTAFATSTTMPPTSTPTPIVTPTPTVTATEMPQVPCTPPPCPNGGSLVCESGNCPGGCGTVCKVPTWPISLTGLEVCHLSIGDQTAIRENANLWAQPDVSDLGLLINKNIVPGTAAQVIDGPIWRRIRRDIEYDGWWFQIKIEPTNQIGWIWEARLDGCRRPEEYMVNQ